ncbi:hypothetical protein BV898_14403 [Hypsibius exemplaris]|uniref:Dehydrogenase/reductase SDR family member 11 n=1 Tax=Hypsibius exemplaris TaxID=2072580 RepID=A0A9X6RJE1_HYPEX|nr:hypothetical protein BV898_14403 [Hypsibius exemplaris]
MDRWRGKTALVTGASAGIGYTITVGLLEAGVNVIGCARNIASLETLQSESTANSATLTSIKCDLVKEEEILSLFKEIETNLAMSIFW